MKRFECAAVTGAKLEPRALPALSPCLRARALTCARRVALSLQLVPDYAQRSGKVALAGLELNNPATAAPVQPELQRCGRFDHIKPQLRRVELS